MRKSTILCLISVSISTGVSLYSLGKIEGRKQGKAHVELMFERGVIRGINACMRLRVQVIEGKATWTTEQDMTQKLVIEAYKDSPFTPRL